ncbi:MAG: hypothetical protein IT224_03960 [Flavobacteriales bacterium]|nr:hypothetical protein [Flavobacteriales bacterium]
MRILRILFLALTYLPLFTAAQERPMQESKNGWYLSPHGTIRILLLFVEVEYDVNREKDPRPDGADHWPKGQLPVWKDNVFDPQVLPVQQAMVSRYYQDISLGNFTVLGDYVDEVIHVKESEYPGVSNAHGIGRFAVDELNKRGSLKTHHGLSIADFDLWKDGGKQGLPKERGSDDPHQYDHIMVITRNSGLPHGTGSTDGGSPGKLFGYGADTQSRFGGNNALPFEILKHEFNHLLIGGNNFHSGGGNASQFESYQLCLQGGWSMMGANGSSLLTCSAWDRDRMGWRPEGATYRIRARSMGGHEVDTDLDPVNGDTGIFVLRDFVTSGDALRIRLPDLPESGYQQWLWVENHQGSHRNGSPTDQFHWEGFGENCITPIEPGLFLQIQIDREERTGTNIFSGSADYLRPVLANGSQDLYLRGDTISWVCPFGGRSFPYVLDPELANPFTGNHEQELPVVDRNGDGKLERGEHFPIGTRSVKGLEVVHNVGFGRPEHAMRMNGVRKIGMCTNPSTANALTLLSTNKREIQGVGGPNVRVIHLNGIAIELQAMDAKGDAHVRISTNDTRMASDQRWCADSIVLPPLRGVDGHSLTVAAGVRLRLDRSRAATRMTQVDPDAQGGPWFSEATRLTITSGASVFLEDRSELVLENGSELHLLAGSRLILRPTAKLLSEPGTRIVQHGNCCIEARNKVLRKLRKQGRLVKIP